MSEIRRTMTIAEDGDDRGGKRNRDLRSRDAQLRLDVLIRGYLLGLGAHRRRLDDLASGVGPTSSDTEVGALLTWKVLAMKALLVIALIVIVVLFLLPRLRGGRRL